MLPSLGSLSLEPREQTGMNVMKELRERAARAKKEAVKLAREATKQAREAAKQVARTKPDPKPTPKPPPKPPPKPMPNMKPELRIVNGPDTDTDDEDPPARRTIADVLDELRGGAPPPPAPQPRTAPYTPYEIDVEPDSPPRQPSKREHREWDGKGERIMEQFRKFQEEDRARKLAEQQREIEEQRRKLAERERARAAERERRRQENQRGGMQGPDAFDLEKELEMFPY